MSNTFIDKNLGEASEAEVRTFASSFLGIDVTDLADAEVRARVRTATGGETIFVANAPAETDQTGAPPPQVELVTGGGNLQGGLGKGDPKVKIILHNEEKDGVIISRHKEVGVNGVVWLLKRGEEITIPYRVFKVLDSAERDVITHDGVGNVLTQKVKNTPFNVVAMPHPQEIADWEAQTARQEMPA